MSLRRMTASAKYWTTGKLNNVFGSFASVLEIILTMSIEIKGIPRPKYRVQFVRGEWMNLKVIRLAPTAPTTLVKPGP